MKYLQDYIEEAQTKAITKHGAFFAVSSEQFDEARTLEIDEYVQLPANLICPKVNVKALMEDLNIIHGEGIKLDKAENSKEDIIYRNLANHECFYTSDISDAVTSLQGYDYSIEEIQEVYYKHLKNN